MSSFVLILCNSSMAAALKIYWLIAVGIVPSHFTTVHYGTAGQLALLKCHAKDNITWRREGNLSLPSGVQVRGAILLFAPLHSSHGGSYTCGSRKGREWNRPDFHLVVSDEVCPPPAITQTLPFNKRINLYCHQKEVLNLSNTIKIKWLKECLSWKYPENSVLVNTTGLLKLPSATKRDSGSYTCLVSVSINGSTFTSARSIHLSIKGSSVIAAPRLVSPEHQEKQVDYGSRVELECSADVTSSENDTFMYWTINNSFVEHDKLIYNKTPVFISSNGRVIGTTSLTVSKVLKRHLNVPFNCIFENPAGRCHGVVFLREVDHSSFYKLMSSCLTVPLAVLALAACFFYKRIDIVLAYRKFLKHTGNVKATDVGVYDAYVSFHNLKGPSSEKPERFTQLLTEKLEKQHGYSLYISGRDDLPGEAKHEVIAQTMRKSRRLLLILSAQESSSTNEENKEHLLPYEQSQYEQTLGLYDALTHNNLKVILVEIDGPLDYSHLPESIQYIKRKQGAPKWKTKVSSGNRQSNRRFWKELLFYMPSVPADGSQTII